MKRLKNALLFSISTIQINSIILILLSLCSLSISSKSLALITHTVNVIHGNKPKVVNIEAAAKKQGFTINGVFYSANTNNLNDIQINQFDGNLKINDFIIKNYTINDLDMTTNYDDSDEDGISYRTPFSVEPTTYSWVDNNGVTIEGNDRARIIGCSSGFSMPLYLTISTKVKTYSEYGIPNESEYADITQQYKIMAEPEICYAKPYQMTLFPNYVWGSVRSILYQGRQECILSGYRDDQLIESLDDYRMHLVNGWNFDNSRNRNSICGGGYNAQVFDPINGFKASAVPHFPTTGFSGAKFQLVMTGNQNDFNYGLTQNPNNSVTIDNQGFVTLVNKPTGPVTIKATFKHDNQIAEKLYTFSLTGIWANPRGNQLYTYQQVTNLCGGESKVPSRAEMSNSPNAPLSWTAIPYSWDAFTRDIGNGLLSEWGMTSKLTYPDSNWSNNLLWFYSRDVFSDPVGIAAGYENRFSVDSWIGQIGTWINGSKLSAVCIE